MIAVICDGYKDYQKFVEQQDNKHEYFYVFSEESLQEIDPVQYIFLEGFTRRSDLHKILLRLSFSNF